MDVDLIIKGAHIVTVPGQAATHALAVHNGRVVATGDDAEGLTARSVYALRGQTVVPGFNDVHAHTVWFGLTLVELDVAEARSLAELYDTVASRASDLRADEWIIGAGFNQMNLGDRYPDPETLTRAAGGRPVWLKHTSGHSSIVNSRALEIIGVDRLLDEGVSGGRIVVDESGTPTGVLEEQAMGLVQALHLPYPLERIEAAIEAATRQYAAEGLTSVTDAGIGGGILGHSPVEFAAYQNVAARSRLLTRQQIMPEASVLFDGGGAFTRFEGLGAGIRSGLGSECLQLGPAKLFLDGSILGATARLSEEYHHCAGSHGYFQGDRQSLREAALDAGRAGWALAMHAVGDEAVDLAADIVEGLRAEGIVPPLPHRVEHGGVVRPDQLVRLAELGLTVVGQPHFLSQYGDGFRRFIGDERAEWSFRSRSLLEAGLPLAITSDRPVAPGAPLAVMRSAMERRTRSGHLYGAAEALTFDQALAAYTTGAAAVSGWAGRKGALTPGQLADFVILESDPAEAAVEYLHDVQIEATFVGGEAVHDPAGSFRG